MSPQDSDSTCSSAGARVDEKRGRGTVVSSKGVAIGGGVSEGKLRAGDDEARDEARPEQ